MQLEPQQLIRMKFSIVKNRKNRIQNFRYRWNFQHFVVKDPTYDGRPFYCFCLFKRHKAKFFIDGFERLGIERFERFGALASLKQHHASP